MQARERGVEGGSATEGGHKCEFVTCLPRPPSLRSPDPSPALALAFFLRFFQRPSRSIEQTNARDRSPVRPASLAPNLRQKERREIE
ncbi:hypothetical protein Mapa_004560 [Marchantia paleacea]|nr:hypothetical protein Mapa_004560 [Marchantia paleacea]